VFTALFCRRSSSLLTSARRAVNSASALSRSAAALVRRLVLLSALLLSDSSHCPCSFRQARGDRGLGPFALSRRSLTETGASQRLLPVRLASLPLQLLLLPEPPISQARGDLAFGPSHHYHHENWRFSAPVSCPTCFRCPPLQPDPR